jgi:FSR family fosmidomycin resistance protein-like MFS transporter
MGIFIAAGTLGYALGPPLVTGVVTHFGLHYIYWTAGLALLVFPFLCRYSPRKLHRPPEPGLTGRTTSGELWRNARPLGLLLLLVTCRSAAFNSFLTFMPVLLANQGFSPVKYGFVLSVFVAAGAAGTLIGGLIADSKTKPGFSIALMLGAALLTFIGTVHAQRWELWLLAALTGALLEMSNAIAVVLAHETVPANKAAASGLMMGLGWGLGALFLVPLGAVADAFGLTTSLTAAALMLSPAILTASLLPARRKVTL